MKIEKRPNTINETYKITEDNDVREREITLKWGPERLAEIHIPGSYNYYDEKADTFALIVNTLVEIGAFDLIDGKIVPAARPADAVLS